MRTIQTLLGHQRLNTTEIYTHVTIIHLRQVYHRTHPAAKQGKPPNLEIQIREIQTQAIQIQAERAKSLEPT